MSPVWLMVEGGCLPPALCAPPEDCYGKVNAGPGERRALRLRAAAGRRSVIRRRPMRARPARLSCRGGVLLIVVQSRGVARAPGVLGTLGALGAAGVADALGAAGRVR